MCMHIVSKQAKWNCKLKTVLNCYFLYISTEIWNIIDMW